VNNKSSQIDSILTPEILKGLATLNEFMMEVISSEVDLLKEIPTYLLTLGGKRIRPALTFLSAKLFGLNEPTLELLNVSAGIELIHMATLLHDDIIDQAPVRRGKMSAYKKYGITNTLLSGNFLFVRAFGLCAKLPPFIIQNTEKACVELTEGEILEGIPSISLEKSIEIAKKKTASLFRLSALSGAFVATKNTQIAEQLGIFGECLGIAFQINDDILDVTSDIVSLGKEPGTDIRERKPSVVNALWFECGSDLSKKVFLQNDFPIDSYCVAAALEEIKTSVVLEKAQQLGMEYVERAKEALNVASVLSNNSINSETLLGLNNLVNFAVSRFS